MSAVDLLKDFPVRHGETYRVASYLRSPEPPHEMLYKSYGSRSTMEEAEKLSKAAAIEDPHVPIFIFPEGRWATLLDPKDLPLADLEGEIEPNMRKILAARKENEAKKNEVFEKETRERIDFDRYALTDEGLKDPYVWQKRLGEAMKQKEDGEKFLARMNADVLLFRAKMRDCLGIAPEAPAAPATTETPLAQMDTNIGPNAPRTETETKPKPDGLLQ